MTQSEKYFFVYHLFNKKSLVFSVHNHKSFFLSRSMYLYVHYCINEPALF